MESKPYRRVVRSRIIRPGQTAPAERGCEGSTPEERFDGVWDLTLSADSPPAGAGAFADFERYYGRG